MFELLLAIGAAIAMGRFGEADRGEGFKWGSITFGIWLLATLLLKIPLVPIIIALVASFMLMTVTKKNYY